MTHWLLKLNYWHDRFQPQTKKWKHACIIALFNNQSLDQDLIINHTASLSNTVERIRPVNGLTRLIRLVRPVQVVKQWFTSRTVGEVYIIRETYGVYTSPRLVRLVKQWFTSRTIGELHRLHTDIDDKQFCRTHTTREWLERQTCYRQCIFFALKTWMPRIAKHNEYSSFSKRESPIAPEYIYSALRSTKAGEAKCATKNLCFSF